MNILLIGSGGREHALAWAIGASPLCDWLYAAPGNPGIEECADLRRLDVADHQAVIAFCQTNEIDLVVVGPEAPLVAGLVDDLAAAGIKAFGPTQGGRALEGSKGFTKDLCARMRHSRPPPMSASPTPARPRPMSRERGAPIVVKADGLAAGKGVVVATTLERGGGRGRRMMFAGALGAAGAEVVIEEFLDGEEASFFALCDGSTALPLASAQDHKRAFDGDTGPNTGGMGAYSPAPVMTPALESASWTRSSGRRSRRWRRAARRSRACSMPA